MYSSSETSDFASVSSVGSLCSEAKFCRGFSAVPRIDSLAEMGTLVRLSEFRLATGLPVGAESSLAKSLEETIALRFELFLKESRRVEVLCSLGRNLEPELFGEMISSSVRTAGSAQQRLLSRIFDRFSRSFSGCFRCSRADPNRSFSSILMNGRPNFSPAPNLAKRSSLKPP